VEADALTRLGELALARGEPARALAWMERGRARAEASNEVEGLTRAHTGLARALLASGRTDEGRTHARSAIALAERMHALFLLWEAHTVLGRLHAAAGERGEARRALTAGVAAIEEWREHVAGDEGPARFLEDKLEPYHALVELEAAAGHSEEAVRWAERAHARTLTDVLRRGGGLAQGPLEGAQAEEERRLERRLAQLHGRRAALNRETDAAEAREQDVAIQAARRELAAFRARVASARPVLRLADDSPAGDPLQGLDPWLGPGHVLLLYSATPGRLHLFVLTSDRGAVQVEHHALPVTLRALAERVESFRRRLAERDLRVRAEARELYRLVMAAAAPRLRGREQVLVVPDGPLWELPFAALVGESGRYLVEDASIAYAPSLLALTLPRPGPLAHGTPTLLAIGNPKAPAAGPALAPLLGAERQARALGRLYGRDATVLVGAEAQEERVRAEAVRFDVLHFATHGLLDDGSPLFSYLTLAGAGNEPERDGRLEAREVLRLRLPARLVVLSACESGRGRVNAGEGLIGLSWAFALAGSPAIVASHWRVDEQGTSDLMLALHRGLLAGRGDDGTVDIAGRLRAAALALMKDPRYRHPFYWAGFFLIGRARV
jgi:CHAT domain-containing protein